MATSPSIEHVRGLLRRVGLDLAFIDPAAPSGAAELEVPLGKLEASLREAGQPELAEAAATARSWVAAGTSERLVTDMTARLAAWHSWMEEAVTAWERSAPLPDWPPELDRPSGVSPPVTVSTAPTAIPTSQTPTPPAVPAPVRRALLDDAAATEPVKVLPDSCDSELMRLFCTEAEELLQDIEQGVLVLESTPTDADTLATVFRGFHTLKGNAAVMRLVVLQRLAHEVESLLDAARRGSRPLDRDAIDVVLAGADVVSRYVAEAARQLDGIEPGRVIPLPVPAVVDRVKTVLATPATLAPPSSVAPPPPVLPPPVPPSQTPEPAVAVASPPATASTPAPLPSIDRPPAPADARPSADRPTGTSSASVRVDTGKLDGLVDLVGELVIAQSMVLQAAGAGGPATGAGGNPFGAADDTLSRSLGRLRGITADLQRTALAMRMVPIRGAFQKMGRIVRDAAVQLGKEIRLVVEGEETELDRTVIEEIGDPLVHMVRNAVDHAIEPPEVRAAAGKTRAGTITLKAFHEGGFVVVQVSDDGRGLDPVRIRAKAVARGLVPADAVLDDRDTLELIFAAGFSTAEQVSDLSGRGVGLDVVRRNVERVRGKVAIESAVGRGTTFTIAMPLTLAIIEGLIVAVGGERFVIPTLAIRESFRPAADGIATVHGRGELVDVRGQQVPLVRLARLFGIADAVADPTQAIVVVLEAGLDRRGLLVDALVGKQEVVIKPLGETFAGRREFAGAAILGDGRVGLILDTNSLVRLGRRSPTETAA